MTEATTIPGWVAGTWVIDPIHSEPGFSVRHLMLSKVRGRFEKFEGEIVTSDDILDTRATVTVDLTSINTIVPALMAGNAVILKHAAQTLLVGERIAEAFRRANLPKGLFHNLVL